MKSILKFLPVALGVLTMASCSNEDFLGSGTQNNGKELIPSVENLVNADGSTTRSAWTAGGTYNVSWQTGDAFRVYDEAVQAYDIFSRKAAGITLDGTADVEAHKYAIFPGDQVYYAGWDKASGLSAVMYIDDAWNYAGAAKVAFGDELKTVYGSNLPMWGAVENETSENLEVNLKYLTSVLDVCVYQKATTKIRVVAFKDNSALGLGTVTAGTPTADGTPTAALTNFANTAGQQTPLSGYFFAQLKDEGQLVKNMNQPLEMLAEYGYVLEINVPASVGDEAHVLIPIIPATYKYLSVQYLVPDATYTECWQELNHYAETEIKRGQVRKTGLEIGEKPTVTTIQVSSLTDLNTKLATAAGITDRIINVELKSGGSLATLNTSTATEYSIVIPNNAKDLTININAEVAASAKALTISGGNAGNVATLNIIGGVTGTKGVTVNTSGELKLGGNYGGNMTITSAKDVTLGLGLESSFSTGNVKKNNNGNGDVIVDANEGTITDISLNAASHTNSIIVNSGTVTTIGNATTAAGDVTIYGGTLTTIKTTTGAITVNGGTATNLVTSTGNLSIGVDSEVETVTTSATTFSASTDLKKLIISGEAGTTVNLTVTDATIDEIEAANRADAATSTLNILSTGHASIKKVTNNNGTRTTINYGAASAWDGEAAAEAEAVDGVIPIYTIGQLASVTTGKKYKLMAASYDISGQDWTPVNVNKDFNGQGKTITGLTNSLFATISGGTIQNLILDNVANATAANTGALAQTVSGSPTIKTIEVKASVASAIGATTGTANSKNIGGLVGTVDGTTVNFINNKVTATVKGYANVGGLIGNVAGGTVNIKTNNTGTTYQSNVTFNKNYKPTVAATASDANCGTFGNLIGSITGTGVTVLVGRDGSTAAAGSAATCFFTDNISAKTGTDAADATKLDFALNRTFNGTTIAKTYQGTANAVITGDVAFLNAIGYSTGTITKLTMFNKTENSLGFDWTINDINVFQ